MVKLKDIFFALSNSGRLEIYKLVLKKEMNLTEISYKTKQKYPNVLKNIKILKEAGMISLEKRIIPETAMATFVKGIPFKDGSVYKDVYSELLKEEKE